jgi:DNA-binding transcriptional MocR family regulator
MVGQFEGFGVRPWTLPRGGFYLWCRLPDGRDAAEVAKAALRERVVLAPGNVFSVTQSATELMRFNVAQMNAQALRIIRQSLR